MRIFVLKDLCPWEPAVFSIKYLLKHKIIVRRLMDFIQKQVPIRNFSVVFQYQTGYWWTQKSQRKPTETGIFPEWKARLEGGNAGTGGNNPAYIRKEPEMPLRSTPGSDTWRGEPDLNRHALNGRQDLNLVRLPISPSPRTKALFYRKTLKSAFKKAVQI